jgi:hypothetical protein
MIDNLELIKPLLNFTKEPNYSTKSLNKFCETTYPNGVIIKAKT